MPGLLQHAHKFAGPLENAPGDSAAGLQMAAFAAGSVCSVLWGGMLILKRQNPGNIYVSQVAPRSWGPALAVGDGATAQKYQHLTSVCSSPQEPLFAPTAASGTSNQQVRALRAAAGRAAVPLSVPLQRR